MDLIEGPGKYRSTTHLESQLRANQSRTRAKVLREIAAEVSRPEHRKALLAIALEYDSMAAVGGNRAKEILQMFRARSVRS